MIISLIFTSYDSFSLSPSGIETSDTSADIRDYLFVLETENDTLELREILSGSTTYRFIPLKDFKKPTSSKFTYWLKLNINIPGRKNVGILIPKSNHTVDLFEVFDSNIIHQTTGMYLSNKNQEIVPFSNILKLTNPDRSEIFLKIKNIYDEKPNLNLRIVSTTEEIAKNNRRNIFDGFSHGLLWLMIIYGLFLYLLHKDKLYLLYSIYIFFISLWYFGCLSTIFRLFPAFPRDIFPYTDVPATIASIFYVGFIRKFASINKLLPKWDRVLKVIPFILLFQILAIIPFIILTKKTILAYNIQDSIIMMVILVIGILSLRLLQTKDKLAIITATGAIFLLAGSFIGISIYLYTLNDDTFIIQKIATVAELLIFTFGISYRYKLIEKSKQEVQKQLIVQLKEIAELQDRVNRELEQKVNERTKEIRDKNEILKIQKDEIEVQKNDLTSSINYAHKIQTALLPSNEVLITNFKDHFILYQPLHIVSGDFYWFCEIDACIFIVAADCTGHGVPGAFMSVLGISLLNEIVKISMKMDTSDILNRLRKELINSLHQTGIQDNTRDGIDLALCLINKNKRKLQFSGGFRPLFLVRKGQLLEFKGDRMPIGIYDLSDSFTKIEIDYFEDDQFYLFSDGYVDQFGGPDRKRFKLENLKRILTDIHMFQMSAQKEILEQKLKEWKGEFEQIDDILVVGIKI
jgi:serine phosphatase RsbU (regulator of sigma subunit)